MSCIHIPRSRYDLSTAGMYIKLWLLLCINIPWSRHRPRLPILCIHKRRHGGSGGHTLLLRRRALQSERERGLSIAGMYIQTRQHLLVPRLAAPLCSVVPVVRPVALRKAEKSRLRHHARLVPLAHRMARKLGSGHRTSKRRGLLACNHSREIYQTPACIYKPERDLSNAGMYIYKADSICSYRRTAGSTTFVTITRVRFWRCKVPCTHSSKTCADISESKAEIGSSMRQIEASE